MGIGKFWDEEYMDTILNMLLHNSVLNDGSLYTFDEDEDVGVLELDGFPRTLRLHCLQAYEQGGITIWQRRINVDYEKTNKMMFDLYSIKLEEVEMLGTRIWSFAQILTLRLTNHNEVSGRELKPFLARLYVVFPRVVNEQKKPNLRSFKKWKSCKMISNLGSQ